MKIRKAIRKDVQRILELFNSDPNLRGDDNYKYNKEKILEFIESPVNRTFVYKIEGKIAGVITAVFLKSSGDALLVDIIVDKDYRKKGIGFKLQSHIEKLARKEGMKFLYLFSEINNKKAHRLFEKGGFEKGKEFYFFSKVLR